MSAKYWSLFLWKKVRTSSALQETEDGSRCLGISRMLCPPPHKELDPCLLGFGRECWCRIGPTEQAIAPAEVFSLVSCSGSQVLKKPTGLGQGGRKQNTGRVGQGRRELHTYPREKTAMKLNQGWGVFLAKTQRHQST